MENSNRCQIVGINNSGQKVYFHQSGKMWTLIPDQAMTWNLKIAKPKSLADMLAIWYDGSVKNIEIENI